MALYSIKNLSFAYPNSKKRALEHINLEISKGEFIVICGKSGCGKSTLLRHFKQVLTPHGQREGGIFFEGTPLEQVDLRTQASKIGFVLQSPENQTVTDKVWHELAFGLESLGLDNKAIRLRVAETASFFGIQEWFDKDVAKLSGGQKQILSLAGVMVMQPEILILDEPTSQLDTISASELLNIIKKINAELGTTVILSEHRLDEVLPICSRTIVMEQAQIIADGTPKEAAATLKRLNRDLFLSMPVPAQIYSQISDGSDYPLTVREGRVWLDTLFENKKINNPEILSSELPKTETAVRLKNTFFKYERSGKDILHDFNLEIPKESVFCLVGGNGTGKSTALGVMSGIYTPYQGKVEIFGTDIRKLKPKDLYNGCLGVLTQNPQALFVEKTVELDLLEVFHSSQLTKAEQLAKVYEIAKLFDIEHLLQTHPYDASGGEQQRIALAKVMLLEPKILLLDEPTKGMDKHFKQHFAGILKTLTAKGVTIILVSHDLEFCAEHGTLCAMLFDGSPAVVADTHTFFSDNSFYTTSANRMSRHIFHNAITAQEVSALCKANLKNTKN